MEVLVGDRRVAIGGPRQLKLLAFLLLHRNRAVPTSVVVEAVWATPGSGTDNRLAMAVTRLRGAIESGRNGDEPRLRATGGGYLLAVGPEELDAEQFARLTRDGRAAFERGELDRADELLDRALRLWRGPPLAEVCFEDFAQGEIRRLEEVRLVALEARIDAALGLGRHAQLVGELEQLIAENPAREELAGRLMLALYRCGRQGAALETYQRTRTHLVTELGLEPGPWLRTLQSQILQQSPLLLQDAARGTTNRLRLPRRTVGMPLLPTPTVGRGREIEAICSLLVEDGVRLVTLTGPGGVGKTRLALTVASAIQSDFADGAAWVELAGVTRAEHVPSAIATVLGVTPFPGEDAADAVRRTLETSQLLLVIDNFEHLLDAAMLVASLYASCAGLKVLTTSREALNLAAEHRVVVTPLELPVVSASVSVAEIEATDASALFVQAARRRDSRFSASAATAPVIAQICAALDGLPLALELAAARTTVLGVRGLAAGLEQAGTKLGEGPRDAPDRQRTLDTAIEWSYLMLDDQQARTFVAFAVFAAGATLEAAQVVTGGSAEAIEALAAKSLLDSRPHPDGTRRLTMLETIRQYGLEQLARHRDEESIRERHLEYFLSVVERSAPSLWTDAEGDALAVLDSEIDNCHTALQWALTARPLGALRLATALNQYWFLRNYPDVLERLDAALQAAGEAAPIDDRARAQLDRARQLTWRFEYESAGVAATAALELFRQLDDDASISRAEYELALLAGLTDDPGAERAWAQAAARHARLAGDEHALGQALVSLARIERGAERAALLAQAHRLLAGTGNYRDLALGYSNAAARALRHGDVADAAAVLQSALAVLGRVRDSPWLNVLILGNLGLARLFSGEERQAADTFAAMLQLCAPRAFARYASEGVAGVAAVAVCEGCYEVAAQLRGAARAMGYPGSASSAVIDDRLEREHFAHARGRLGTESWQRAEAAGAELSYDEAIGLALEQAGLAKESAPVLRSVGRPMATGRL